MAADRLISCQVLVHYLEKESRGCVVKWQPVELANLFHDFIDNCDANSIEILIDALDECSDADVLDIVRKFEKSIQISRTHQPFRVCWTSRFYPHISFSTLQGISLVVDHHNKDDIRKYVQGIFPRDADESLSEELIERARGIFLWASLVTARLQNAFNSGQTTIQLRKMLQEIPEGLDNLFFDIFRQPAFTPSQQKDLKNAILFVSGAIRPLTLQELYTAMQLMSPECSLIQSRLASEDSEQFRKRLTCASGGLIEVVEGSDQRSRVQFIHESVREFFVGTGLHVLQLESRKALCRQSHHNFVQAAVAGFAKICNEVDSLIALCRETKHFKTKEAVNSLVPPPMWRPPGIDFLERYARDHLFSHMKQIFVPKGLNSAEKLPETTLKLYREALVAYLLFLCYYVNSSQRIMGLARYQLNIVTSLGHVFKLDFITLANLTDWPIRYMIITGCLHQLGICYRAEGFTEQERHLFKILRLSAVFGIQSDESKSDKGANLVQEQTRDDQISINHENFNELCTISFEVLEGIESQILQKKLFSNTYITLDSSKFAMSYLGKPYNSDLKNDQGRSHWSISNTKNPVLTCLLYHYPDNTRQCLSGTEEPTLLRRVQWCLQERSILLHGMASPRLILG